MRGELVAMPTRLVTACIARLGRGEHDVRGRAGRHHRGAGGPQAVKLADGPLAVAGTPYLDADVTGLGLDSRALFALAVGTTPADARVIQNNVLPHREPSVNLGARRTVELPSVAAEVAERASRCS